MLKQKKWIWILISSIIVLVLAVIGVTLAFTMLPGAIGPRAQKAQAAFAAHSQIEAGLEPAGYDGGRGWFGDHSNQDKLLAEALGITVAELQAARETAYTTAIQQAVEEELITQEQADQLLLGGGFGFGGRGGHLGGRGKFGDIDGEALLAEALGITVEELQNARQEAQTAAIQQAIEDGRLTQEQGEQLLAHNQLKSYIDPEALLAEALGITVEELQTARTERKSLPELVGELNLEAATVRSDLRTAYQNAVQQAVEDGVITQDQADQVLSGAWGGFDGFGGRDFGKHGGSRGHGDFGGRGGSRGSSGFGGYENFDDHSNFGGRDDFHGSHEFGHF